MNLCFIYLLGTVCLFFSSSKQFCVATTHLLYNPKAGEVKLAQMSCLLAELHKIATIPGKCTHYPSPLPDQPQATHEL